MVIVTVVSFLTVLALAIGCRLVLSVAALRALDRPAPSPRPVTRFVIAIPVHNGTIRALRATLSPSEAPYAGASVIGVLILALPTM
jgi:hypothetical protein